MIIAITGGIGTGKSTVAKMFAELGAKIIDADRIARRVMAPGSRVRSRIKKKFGTTDRKRLSEIVFSDKKALKALCAITHPAIIAEIKNEARKIRYRDKKAIIALDAPLLFEAKQGHLADKTIVVVAKRENQIKRAVKNLKISRQEAQRRIRSQMPLAKKKKLADFVIDNNGSLREAKRQVKKIWMEVTK